MSHSLTTWSFVGKVMSLLFNMLSRLVIAFLSRSKHLLISWLQSPSAVILEPQKIKSVSVSSVSPSICHEVMGPDAMILVFWMLSFKSTFSLSSFTFIKRLFSSSSLSAIRVVSSVYLRLLIFLLAILIPACASSSLAQRRIREQLCYKQLCYKQLWASQVELVVKNLPANSGRYKRHGFNPWTWKIPWRTTWQSTPVFLPGESMDRGAWRAAVCLVAQNQTWLKQLSTHTWMSNCMPIKWTSCWKSAVSKNQTKNRKYEQFNNQHWNWISNF